MKSWITRKSTEYYKENLEKEDAEKEDDEKDDDKEEIEREDNLKTTRRREDGENGDEYGRPGVQLPHSRIRIRLILKSDPNP